MLRLLHRPAAPPHSSLPRPRPAPHSPLDRQRSTSSLPAGPARPRPRYRLSYSLKRIRRRRRGGGAGEEPPRLPAEFAALQRVESEFQQFLAAVQVDLQDKLAALRRFKARERVGRQERSYAALQIFMLEK